MVSIRKTRMPDAVLVAKFSLEPQLVLHGALHTNKQENETILSLVMKDL